MRFLKYKRFRIGLRTLKTAIAVSIAMLIVTAYGATTSKLIFAMLGAMAAMEPTLKESFEACLTQIVGLILGMLAGVVLLYLPLNPLIVAGIGIVFVITFYNLLQIRFSPALSCLMVVTICTSTDIMPFTYGLGRLWDTTIGLAVGMFINTLVFPYDTSRRIQTTAECLDKEVITFLEDMFDGDEHLPNTKKMSQIIDDLQRLLNIFSSQWVLLYLKRNRHKLRRFLQLQGKARQLIAQMEVLCQMDYPGRLTDETRELLEDSGATIKDERIIDVLNEVDIVTNYHVRIMLESRNELIHVLKRK